jgi:hypothetical protein
MLTTNMIASELRIGNLVNYEAGWGGLYEHEFNIDDFDNIDQINPILLTEEWILKFDGFFKDEEYLSIGRYDYKYCFKYRDWANNWAFYIEYTDSGNSNDDGVKYPIAFDIKYVHQLQNLYFALTGEELIFNT